MLLAVFKQPRSVPTALVTVVYADHQSVEVLALSQLDESCHVRATTAVNQAVSRKPFAELWYSTENWSDSKLTSSASLLAASPIEQK